MLEVKMRDGRSVRVIALTGDYDGYIQIEAASYVDDASFLDSDELNELLEVNYGALHREWLEIQQERADYRQEEWAERGRYHAE